MSSRLAIGLTCMPTLITKLETVAVPVADQDRAKSRLEELGFGSVIDAELQPGFRWVEHEPPDGGTTFALVTAGDGLPAGIDTGIRLITPDARVAHATLTEKDFDVGELLDWESAPLMFSFLDPDGNRFYVSQAG